MLEKLGRVIHRAVVALIAVSVLPIFTIAHSPSASSTQVIRVGDPSIDGSFLKPFKNAWKVVYEFPGKEPFLVGTWTDELAAVDTNGRHLLKRVQMADYAKYNILTTYTNVFDPKTMAPRFPGFQAKRHGRVGSP